MFSGPSAGGLQAGPTAGSISTNPAAYIPIAGLAVEQVASLRGELQDKHPLLTAATPLGQNLVSGLPDSLAARATTSQLSQGLAAKQDIVTDGSLTIARTAGLQSALDERAKIVKTYLQNRQF